MNLRTSLILGCLLVRLPIAFAADYYVSLSGNDGNSGTSVALPFKTIQKAALVMTAGDTCHIREGVYRETVTPANSGSSGSPIRFVPYGSENVEVTGLDAVSNTGWSVHSGQIYQTSYASSVTEVFVNGQRVSKARYPKELPNIYDMSNMLDISMVNNFNGGGVPGGMLYGQNFPAGYWNGATIVGVCGSRWVASCARIVTSSNDSYTATLTSAAWGSNTVGGNGKGFITDSLNALYASNQWHQESGKIYLRTKDNSNPSAATVEARVRNYAFDLNGKSYIEIEGLHFRASRLNLRDAQNCTISGCTARFVAPYQYFRHGFNRNPGLTPNSWEYTGIEVSGSHNVISDCYVGGSWGDGLSVWGSYNTVKNCLIENTDWARVDSACLSITGHGHIVRNNTMRTSGRGILIHRQLTGGLVTMNNLSQSGRGGLGDHGVTYDFANDGAGTEISYNWISDGEMGVYLDGSCANHLVHHNVIWNCSPGILCNSPSINAHVLNNTFYNSSTSISVNAATSVDFTNKNNLTRRDFSIGQYVSNNMAYGNASPFLDEKNEDFRLAPAGAAIDAGMPILGITDGHVGTAPDVGAYESGGASWVPGSSLTSPGFADLVPVNPDRFRVTQAGLNQNQVSWADRASNETKYSIYRRASGEATYTLIATLVANSSAFLDTTAQTGVTYSYYVTASNDVGESAGTRPMSVRTLSNKGPILYAINADDSRGVVFSGSIVGSCDTNDWVKYSNVDLRSGFTTLRARFSTPGSGKFVEIRTGSNTGPLLGMLTTTSTGSWAVFEEQTALLLAPTKGIHDVYFVFKGGSGVGNFNWFQFEDAFAGTSFSRTIEFETADASSGVSPDARGFTAADIGDWVRIPRVNLGIEATRITFLISVAPGFEGRSIQVRTGSTTGPLLGTLVTASTGSWSTYRPQQLDLSGGYGIQDLYFVFGGGASVANLDSFDLDIIAPPPGGVVQKIEAESFNASSGIAVYSSGKAIGSLDSNDWVRYNNVDFGIGGSNLAICLGVPGYHSNKRIEARIGSTTGPIIGVHTPAATGNYGIFRIQNMTLASVSGVHDLYLVSKGGSGVCDIDYIELHSQDGYTLSAPDYSDQSGAIASGDVITSLDHNDWVGYRHVWLGAGVEQIGLLMAVENGKAGQTVEVRLDSATGPLLGMLTTVGTGSPANFVRQDVPIPLTWGLRDLYLVFKGGSGLGNIKSLFVE